MAMPRTARASAGGYCYHVLNRGNGRAEVFHKRGDFEAFLEMVAVAKARRPMRAGLLRDAQPLPPGALAVRRRRPEPVDAMAADDARAAVPQALRLERSRLAGPVQGVSHPGRRASVHALAVRRAERPPRWVGGRAEDWPHGSLHAVVEPPGPVELEPARGRGRRGWRVNRPDDAAELAAMRQCVARGPPSATRPGREPRQALGLEASLRPRGRPRGSEK